MGRQTKAYNMINRKINILLIEDNPADARLIEEYLEVAEDFNCNLLFANSLSSGLDIILKNNLDLLLLDLSLPDSQGLDTVKKVLDKKLNLPIVILTGLDDKQKAKSAIAYGVEDFLVKGQFSEEFLIRVIEYSIERKKATRALEQSHNKIKKTLDGTMDTLASLVESRDPYTVGHQKRVSDLAIAITGELDVSEKTIENIKTAALIHDIGKISLPISILTKPGKISEIEYSLIKTHTTKGYDIVKNINFPNSIAKTILQHHERIDGSGYPKGLKADEIIIEAKIIGVADVLEAMSSHRPYRPALGIKIAMREIIKNKGKLYDPEIADICVKLFKDKKFNLKN